MQFIASFFSFQIILATCLLDVLVNGMSSRGCFICRSPNNQCTWLLRIITAKTKKKPMTSEILVSMMR